HFQHASGVYANYRAGVQTASQWGRRGTLCLRPRATPWSLPWPAVFSATRGVILGRREPEAPILKTCLLGLLIACLCASAADLPKLPPETMGLIDQARSLPPEFSADTLLTLAASRVITERAWKLQIIEEASTAAAHAQLPYPFVCHVAVDVIQCQETGVMNGELNALGLQAKAIEAMLALNPQKALAMFQELV